MKAKTLVLLGLTTLFSAAVYAQVVPNVVVDEFGKGTANGVTLPATVGADPSGGVVGANVLYYTLPFIPASGDVAIMEGSGPTAPVSDLIRFFPNPTGGSSYLIFYSDNSDGSDAPADSGIPQFATTTVFQEPANGQLFYQPLVGGPGNYLRETSYQFISDGDTVPDGGASALLLGLGLLGLWGAKRFTR